MQTYHTFYPILATGSSSSGSTTVFNSATVGVTNIETRQTSSLNTFSITENTSSTTLISEKNETRSSTNTAASSSGSTGLTTFFSQNLTARGSTTSGSTAGVGSASGATTSSGTSGLKTKAATTSTTRSTSRSFSSTSTTTTSFSFINTITSVTGTSTVTSTITSTNATNTSVRTTSSTTSTTFSGLVFTSAVTTSINKDFLNRDLEYSATVNEFEEFIDKNEWGYLATNSTSSIFEQISSLAVSTLLFTDGIQTTTDLALVSISQAGGSSTYTLTNTFQNLSTSTYTCHTIITTSTSSATLIFINPDLGFDISNAQLPPVTNSTSATTFSAEETVTTTITGLYVVTSSASRTQSANQANLGDALSIAAASWKTFIKSTTVVSTVTQSKDLSFVDTTPFAAHMFTKYVSVQTISTTCILTVTFSGTDAGVVGNSTISIINAYSTNTFTFSGDQGKTQTTAQTSLIFSNASTTTFQNLIIGSVHDGLVVRVGSEGFRPVTNSDTTATFGTIISLDTLGLSTITIPLSSGSSFAFPFFTRQQIVTTLGISDIGAILIGCTYPGTTSFGQVSTLGGSSATFSFSGMSFTESLSVDTFANDFFTITSTTTTGTATSDTATTTGETDSITFSLSYLISGSKATSSSYVVSTDNLDPFAFGGYADISTAKELGRIGNHAYKTTIRPRTGGADTTQTSFLNDASRQLISVDVSNIKIVRGFKAFAPLQNVGNGGQRQVTTRKYYYNNAQLTSTN